MGAALPDTAGDGGLAYVEFYVGDIDAQSRWLADRYDFRVVARSRPERTDARSVALGHGEILLLLTEARDGAHPAAAYVERHGDGVANIAIATGDVRAAFTEAVARGAEPVRAPTVTDGHTTAAIRGFGDVVHTFVTPARVADRCPPGMIAVDPAAEPGSGGERLGLRRVDHFAVCVEPGRLDAVIAYYETALGFRNIFEERIVVGAQAMNSKVVRSPSGELTFTVIEPDTSRDRGQIDEFLEQHDGAGVQHVAFSTENVVRAVGALRDRGVEFLTTPSSYYDLLGRRLDVSSYRVDELRDLDILVDSDHGGQLFQIFTRSAHPRHTFFFEVIERQGAQTFGSGNIKALYEAVETERIQTRDVVG
jgi:4-hydroxymandelate synthase